MKEMKFSKEEATLIQECLQNEIYSLKFGFFGQDMETTNKNAKREDDCEKLIKKFQRAEKKIKVSSAKGKGRNLQYYICRRIAKIFGIEFNQADDNCLVHSREMGQHGTDVIVRGKLYSKFPYDIECKAHETLSIPEWIKQAKSNCKDGRDWLLVFRKQTLGKEPFVLMEWNTFEKLFLTTQF